MLDTSVITKLINDYLILLIKSLYSEL